VHTRRRAWPALVGGLLMIAAFGMSGSAQAAATQPVRSADSSISPAKCFAEFYLYTDPDRAAGFISTDNFLFFDTSVFPDLLCQAFAPGSTKIVVIFDLSAGAHNGCLALNADTGSFYLHSPAACDAGTASYLQWKFTPVSFEVYELQNQYYPSCLYDSGHTQAVLAISAGCSRPDHLEWFDYNQAAAG
jgi:hypothetical protein